MPQVIAYVQGNGNTTAKIALITYFGMSKNLMYIELIEQQLNSGHPEMRIQALKSIFQMNYITDSAKLSPFFYSEIWEERMFATKIAGVLSLKMFEEQLVILLGDSNWWVRYYAAEAILQIGGEHTLSLLAVNHSDPFARNMALQWISIGRQVNKNE
jgi:HEAT repeat protein